MNRAERFQLRSDVELLCSLVSPGAVAADWLAERSLSLADWWRLTALAERQGLTAQLATRLRNHPDSVPEEVAFWLEERQGEIAAVNLLLTSELQRVVAVLEAAGIEVLAFKGPTLAVLAYGRLADREFGDIDILVPEEAAQAAAAALAAAGLKPSLDLEPDEWPRVLAATKDLGFESRMATLIELHWTALPRRFPGRLDHGPTFATARRVAILGTDLLCPSVEELTLILAIHGCISHAWSQLSWLADLAYLIARHPELDWLFIQERAESFGGGRVLRISVALAADTFGVQYPEALAPPDRSSERAERVLVDRLTRGFGLPGRGLRWYFQQTRLWITVLEGPVPGLQAAWGLVRPGPGDVDDFPWLRKNRWLWPLVALLRPFRLLWRYLRRRSVTES